METTFGELKNAVLDHLAPKEDSLTSEAHTGFIGIYLVYDQNDAERAERLRDYLRDQGLEVMTLADIDSKEDTVKNHRAYLERCDALWIYHDQSSREWLHRKLNDIRKAPGYRMGKAPLKSLIYRTAPDGKQTQEADGLGVQVVSCSGDSDFRDLDPFITDLKREFTDKKSS